VTSEYDHPIEHGDSELEYDELGYFCTGLRRGSHDRAIQRRVVLSYPVVPGSRRRRVPRGDRLGLELVCPECGEKFRLGRRKRQRLAEAGYTEWDISRPLPF
jgi:hypothetical protein